MHSRFSITFLLLSFFVGINLSFAQTQVRYATITENVLANTNWKVDRVPFENNEQKNYTLSTKSVDDNFDAHWGHFISFTEKTFTSSYSAPCGNDCFTSVSGEYSFVARMTIKVKVISIVRIGFCSEKSETLNKDYGNYELTKIETGWKLTKSE